MPGPLPILELVVIDVRERIDEAAQCFRSLGFLLTPRGHHTLGWVNHLAMFATDYVELLGFGESGSTRAEIARFPVGLNGLVFKTADAEAKSVHEIVQVNKQHVGKNSAFQVPPQTFDQVPAR